MPTRSSLLARESRSTSSSVPRARRGELKRALLGGLTHCRKGDGLIHGTLRAALARARKPAEAAVTCPSSRETTATQRPALSQTLCEAKARTATTQTTELDDHQAPRRPLARRSLSPGEAVVWLPSGRRA